MSNELNLEEDFILSPENEITDISFDFEGAHMALCHKTQGFSANNKPHPMLIKANDIDLTDPDAIQQAELIKQGDAEVMIETDMVTFLTRWMDMFFADAVALANLLGFEEEETQLDEFIEERMEGVTILQSASVGSIQMIAPISEVKKLKAFIDSNEKLKDSFSEGNPEMKKEEEISKKSSPQQPSEETKTNQGQIMADKKTDQEKDLDKATALAEVEAKTKAEAQEKEKAQAQADLETRIATLEKAASDAEAENKVLAGKVDIFEKANQERLEKAFISKVTTYSFITEEEREEFAKTLLEVDNEAVIVALDKAQAAIVALGKPQGVDGGVLNLRSGAGSNRVKEMIMKEHGLTDVSK